MGFLKNKHIIVALLIAPILALISYFSVDAVVAEKPHAAIAGASYELLERSNCRYSSGACDLKNGDMHIAITPNWLGDETLRLTLNSSQPLEKAVSARVNVLGEEVAPAVLQKLDDSGLNWSTELATPDADLERLHLAVSINDTWYYADSALKFIHYKTATDQDFRQ